jgi:hypothetical protein
LTVADDWLEGRKEFLRDLEHEAVELRRRASDAGRTPESM